MPQDTIKKPDKDFLAGNSGGLIGSQTNPEPKTEPLTEAAQATPEAPKIESPGIKSTPQLAEVNPETETVEGRLNNLTSGKSSYVNLARGDAERAGNKRGMINSAMSAGAGEEAAIRAALPIAQQDATAYRDQSKINQGEQNKFNVNEQSANLNMAVDSFRSELSKSDEKWSKDLQTKMELTLADEKLSNDVKIQYVQNIAQLTTDATNQIVDIGLSDRTAEAQASAIERVNLNRDASIKVYEDLLAESPGWNWGTDFTPETVITEAEQTNYWNAPGGEKPLTEPKIGDIVGGKRYQGNGIWSSRFANNDYDPTDF